MDDEKYTDLKMHNASYLCASLTPSASVRFRLRSGQNPIVIRSKSDRGSIDVRVRSDHGQIVVTLLTAVISLNSDQISIRIWAKSSCTDAPGFRGEPIVFIRHLQRSATKISPTQWLVTMDARTGLSPTLTKPIFYNTQTAYPLYLLKYIFLLLIYKPLYSFVFEPLRRNKR